MGAAEAATAQGMATRHRRSVKAIVAGVGEINALLAKMIKGGRVKWGGYGTDCLWYVRKLKETSSWVTGQLGTRSFEEKDPMDEAKLPYCFIDETYGVSEKSIKTNRAAGDNKLYDIQKENARNAQNALYRALAAAMYSNGSDAKEPVGLAAICGDAYETGNDTGVLQAKTYAGISYNAGAAITNWNKAYATMGWDLEYWYPTVAQTTVSFVTVTATATWSTEAVLFLQAMTHKMSRTADLSGTGRVIKPDLALMATDPWASLIGQLSTSEMDVAGVPLGTTDPSLANFTTVRVGGLDCVFDEGVPDDSGSLERVFILDSKAFYIDSLNTKSEGLIEGQWEQKDPAITGGVGVYKANLALVCETPQAVGVILGCND